MNTAVRIREKFTSHRSPFWVAPTPSPAVSPSNDNASASSAAWRADSVLGAAKGVQSAEFLLEYTLDAIFMEPMQAKMIQHAATLINSGIMFFIAAPKYRAAESAAVQISVIIAAENTGILVLSAP